MTGWLLAIAVANALDAGTSCAAFARGFHEGNPLLPSSCGGVVAVKAGMVTGAAIAGARGPRWVRWTLVAVPAVAVAHNLHALRGRP